MALDKRLKLEVKIKKACEKICNRTAKPLKRDIYNAKIEEK